jgi:hypothetical protein
LWHHSDLLGSVPSSCLQSFVTIVVLSAILRQPRLRNLNRIMNCLKCEIGKKRLAIAAIFADRINQEIGKASAGVVIGGETSRMFGLSSAAKGLAQQTRASTIPG